MGMIFFIIIVWVICGIVAAKLGEAKNRSFGESFAIGLILGVFGVVIVALLPPGVPTGMRAVMCPRCNTMQNISGGQSEYECWRCKANIPIPPPQAPKAPYTPKTVGIGDWSLDPVTGKVSHRKPK
jgi:hypothetical protein